LIPRSGIEIVLRDLEEGVIRRAIPDFAGYVLFEGLPFAEYSASIEQQVQQHFVLTKETPDHSTTLFLATR
jgi:hypothetical protein